MRLKWEWDGKAEQEREQGKLFDLCPLDNVRGGVNVIESNTLVHLLHDTVPNKKALHDHLKSPIEWKNGIFYAIRFFRNEK